MGLLTLFSKYTAYFHDGDVLDVTQSNDEIILWMESAQIPPDEMLDEIPLSNSGRLNGRLHLTNVNYIYENGNKIQTITKLYDRGDIYDFVIEKNEIVILITWQSVFTKQNGRKKTDMIEYRIGADNIYWENTPKVNHFTQKPIELYDKYFTNGSLFKIDLIDQQIRFLIESTEIERDPKEIPYGLTKRRTIVGELLLAWPRDIKLNGCHCDKIQTFNGTALIKTFSIGYHVFQLEYQLSSKEDQNSKPVKIEVTFGAIRLRTLPESEIR